MKSFVAAYHGTGISNSYVMERREFLYIRVLLKEISPKSNQGSFAEALFSHQTKVMPRTTTLHAVFFF
jgi:hypothetical protein